MSINKYDLNDRSRNKVINYDQYQKQSPKILNFNNSPSKPQKIPEDEIKLSNKNKNLADDLTKETLKRFKLETDQKKLKKKNKEAKKTNTGFDYFI